MRGFIPPRFLRRIHVPLPVGLLFLAWALPLWSGTPPPSPGGGKTAYRKALWVTRFEYKSAEDIRQICAHAASTQFTDILFQVRGAGTVCFKSPYEPWAWELNGDSIERGLGVDPGWDPLATAIAEGHRRGLRIHAWVNVMPAWSTDKNPPVNSGQLYVKHRSWLMVQSNGEPMRAGGFYAFLEPGLPEVRDYLRVVITQLARDYDVDGIHLDYIRYPLVDETKVDVSYHPQVRRDFRERFGKTPEEAPEQWLDYRRSNIAATIRGIRDGIKQVRPNIELTSTCMADPVKGRNGACQDPNHWIDQGLVDAVVPMAYVRNDMKRFVYLMEPFMAPQRRSHVWAGIWPRKDNSQYADQIRMASDLKMSGVAIFSYSELFPKHNGGGKSEKIYRTFVSLQPKSEVSGGIQVASANPPKRVAAAAPPP
ncbi:family 10 glycosylhydrolase, partial [Candidatus Sumerlaeota bacterium]|nr:family 10 glycosylhydrolase [Candidatus Sumerlaeota bacterium]